MGFKLSLAIGVMCGVMGVAIGAGLARADSQGPILVIPGKPGIPVMINGYDASYTIVEGDWGLARPGQVSPVIVSGPLIRPSPYHPGHYYPYVGRRPGYGRREVDPPADRRMPRPAPGFYREWGAESQPLPATIDQPDATPLIVAPTVEMGGWDRRHDRRPYRPNGFRPRPRH